MANASAGKLGQFPHADDRDVFSAARRTQEEKQGMLVVYILFNTKSTTLQYTLGFFPKQLPKKYQPQNDTTKSPPKPQL